MIYNIKNVFRIAAIVCTSAWLSSCSTYVNPFSSLYWKGKNIKEFIEDKELAVNETKICKEKDKAFFIYSFAKPMYQIFDREVGRSYNAFGTTIYTQRENVFTGNYWTYAFTDLIGNITSYRAATGFGDLDKEFNCRALGQTDDKELTSILTRESLWMSIVNSADNTKMVWASNKAHSTQKAAEKDALEQCKDEGNKNCKVMASYSNICLSSGIGARNGTYFDIFGFGWNKEQANKDVIEQCKSKGGKDCKIVVEGLCATACDMEHETGCILPEPKWIKP